MFPDDQEIQWMASERQSGSTPTYLQKAYTNGGYYILRNKWDDQSMMMILKNNNNPNNKYHKELLINKKYRTAMGQIQMFFT